MAWLQETFGNSGNMGLQLTLIFLALVVALLVLFWLFRKIFGGGTARLSKGRQPRLSVTDAAVVDDKRRLVLVRRDNVEHLVMIGGPSDIVVETNIVRAAPVQVPAQPTVQQQPPVSPAPQQAVAEPVSPAAPQTAVPAAQPVSEPKAPAGNFADRLSGKTTAGIAATGAAAGAAAAVVVDKVEDAAGTGSEIVSNAGEAVAETGTKAAAAAAEASNPVRDALEELAETSSDAISDASDATADLGGSLAEGLEDALGLDDDGEAAAIQDNSVPEVSLSSSNADDDMKKLLEELSAER